MKITDGLPPFDPHKPKALDRVLEKELTPQAMAEARKAIQDLGRQADREHNTKQDAVAVGILAGWRLCQRYWLSSAETLPQGFSERLQSSPLR